MLLERLKLVDPDGRVSLTNLAIYVVLGVIITQRGTLDVNALGALLTVLGAQRAKLWQQDKRESRDFAKVQAELTATRKELGIALKSSTARSTSLPSGLR